MALELKGKKGGEAVEFHKLKGVVKPKPILSILTRHHPKMFLQKFWPGRFFAPTTEGVRIFFDKRRPDEVVQLRHPELYHITFVEEPAEWDCNLRLSKGDVSFDEKNCNEIHQGIFRWKGNYLVEKRYQNMY